MYSLSTIVWMDGLLTIVTDSANEERILHVPEPAMAGYAGEVIDPEFVQELPAYHLPGYEFQQGTFRSFDISGDSMTPLLQPGDKVVCRFIEPRDWLTSILDNHVYVIVSRGNVVIKRVINNLSRHRHLMLKSDNEEYRPYRLNINDIREVWYVKTRISTFDHSLRESESVLHDQMESLQSAFMEQKQLLKMLLEKENHLAHENKGNG